LSGERTEFIRGHGGQEIQRRIEDHVDLAAFDDVDLPFVRRWWPLAGGRLPSVQRQWSYARARR
jgi:hypothetical protein